MDLLEVLSEFDSLERTNLDENQISIAIAEKIASGDIQPTLSAKAEMIGFALSEDYEKREYTWGGYYGPRTVYTSPDGSFIELPKRDELTAEMVEYWGTRVDVAINPVVKARYIGLYYDLSQKYLGIKPTPDLTVRYIQFLTEIADGGYSKFPFSTYTKLERALNLAIRYKKPEQIAAVKKSILSYEQLVGADDKPGLWGQSFEMILKNKGALVTPEEELEIVFRMEARLMRLEVQARENYLRVATPLHAAVEHLAEYHNKKGQRADLLRVINSWCQPILGNISSIHPLQANSWVDRIERFYRHYSFKKEADSMMVLLRELGDKVADSMQTISSSMDVSREDIEKFLEKALSGEPESVLIKLVILFLPNKEESWKAYQRASKNAVLMNMMPIHLQDERGRVTAVIGPAEDDQEGRLIHHMTQDISFGFLLHIAFGEAKRRKVISKESVVAYLRQAPIITESHWPIVEAAIEAYFADNHLAFAHLVLPQIEQALRNLLEQIGGTVMKRSDDKQSLQLRTLNDLLRDPKLQEFLSPDVTLYLRVVLADQRGLNLRNRALHGILGASNFGFRTSDNLFHVLLCLGLVGKDGDG